MMGSVAKLYFVALRDGDRAANNALTCDDKLDGAVSD